MNDRELDYIKYKLNDGLSLTEEDIEMCDEDMINQYIGNIQRFINKGIIFLIGDLEFKLVNEELKLKIIETYKAKGKIKTSKYMDAWYRDFKLNKLLNE